MVMTAVGAQFDSTKQLINGPANAISIALLSALAVVPDESRVQAAVRDAYDLLGDNLCDFCPRRNKKPEQFEDWYYMI